LSVDRPTHAISDADVDAEIEAIRFRFAAKEEKNGPAERGDYVRCDIRVKDGAETTADLTDQEIRVEDVVYFNDGQINDFAKEMVGAKADDHRTLPLTLSKEIVNEAAAGKTLSAEIVVQSVLESKAPALDEKFFKDFGVGDLGELRDWVQKILEHASSRCSSTRCENKSSVNFSKRQRSTCPITSSVARRTRNFANASSSLARPATPRKTFATRLIGFGSKPSPIRRSL